MKVQIKQWQDSEVVWGQMKGQISVTCDTSPASGPELSELSLILSRNYTLKQTPRHKLDNGLAMRMRDWYTTVFLIYLLWLWFILFYFTCIYFFLSLHTCIRQSKVSGSLWSRRPRFLSQPMCPHCICLAWWHKLCLDKKAVNSMQPAPRQVNSNASSNIGPVM